MTGIFLGINRNSKKVLWIWALFCDRL